MANTLKGSKIISSWGFKPRFGSGGFDLLKINLFSRGFNLWKDFWLGYGGRDVVSYYIIKNSAFNFVAKNSAYNFNVSNNPYNFEVNNN